MRKHCWHPELAQTWGSPPPREIEVCCHCNARRQRMYRKPPGHGPYLPDSMMGEAYHTSPGRECVEREGVSG